MKLNEGNLLRALYFMVFSCTAAWLPIFADFLKDRGMTGLQTSLILSTTPVMMFAVQPFYGMLADRLGYKRCLLFSTALASLSYLLYLFEGGFWYLLAVTVVMAVFYNTAQPLLDSLSLRLTERDPSFSYGTLRIAGAAGWSFTGIIVGHFIDAVNLSVIFISSSISMALAFGLAFFLAGANGGAAQPISATAGVPAPKQASAWTVFANKPLLFFLLAVVLISIGGTTIWNFYSIYLKENGATASLVGFGLSFQGLCELPLFYFSAKIIFRLGVRRAFLLTVFVTALRMLLYFLVKNPVAAIGIEVLHGVSWSLFWVVCVEQVNALVREEWRATGQSLLYAAYFGAGAILGNFWTGWLYDSGMKIGGIFLLNAGLVAAVGVLAWAAMFRKSPLP
jgi:MFS transporter, PPP family, 3-phenylpropionic acid transporter